MKPILKQAKMNKLEQRWANELEIMKLGRLIIDYRFEPFNLRLADNTFYRIDFLVIYNDRFEIHEVKGFLRDDANVKFKVAAEQFPWFHFKMIFWKNKQWKIIEY